MKSSKSILMILAGLVTLITACKKYETFPTDQVNINRVFNPLDSLGTNAGDFLNSIYAQLLRGHNRIDGTDYLDAASDDAISSNAAALKTVTLLSNGDYNSGTFSDDITSPGNDNLWAYSYATIRMANIFINNIGIVPVKGALPNGVGTRWQWQSEARFLRALFYFELVKRYGGVPLLGDKVYGLNDNLRLPRNSFADCIKYIVSECDAIKDSLLTVPLTSTANYGRATKGAALALKARVLLYAASPLFNGKNIDPGNPLTGYKESSPDKSRWQLAANAAADVIKLGAYSLDITGGTAGGSGFRDVFLTQNNPEIIFVSLSGSDNGTKIESANAPVGFPAGLATGNTSPTQNLVDAFPMQNGLGINQPGSGYDPSHPYLNRDPRLASTVFYEGYIWLQTPLKMYEGGQSKPNNGKQQTLTGYYLHKFMGNSENSSSFTAHSEDWVMFRYAEVLLNYAEAENEYAGPTDSAYQFLIAIRQRAGIAAGTSGTYGLQPLGAITQDSLRNAIQNERRLELAFEEHRFFDIRRWRIAGAGDGPALMNKPRRGVIITNSFGILSYNYGAVDTAIFRGNFTSKRYLYPIPYDEVVKDPQMKQNFGW